MAGRRPCHLLAPAAPIPVGGDESPRRRRVPRARPQQCAPDSPPPPAGCGLFAAADLPRLVAAPPLAPDRFCGKTAISGRVFPVREAWDLSFRRVRRDRMPALPNLGN